MPIINKKVNKEYSETIEEIADIQEVLEAICEYKKFDKKNLESIKKQKLEKRGAFKDRIILDES